MNPLQHSSQQHRLYTLLLLFVSFSNRWFLTSVNIIIVMSDLPSVFICFSVASSSASVLTVTCIITLDECNRQSNVSWCFNLWRKTQMIELRFWLIDMRMKLLRSVGWLVWPILDRQASQQGKTEKDRSKSKSIIAGLSCPDQTSGLVSWVMYLVMKFSISPTIY